MPRPRHLSYGMHVSSADSPHANPTCASHPDTRPVRQSNKRRAPPEHAARRVSQAHAPLCASARREHATGADCGLACCWGVGKARASEEAALPVAKTAHSGAACAPKPLWPSAAFGGLRAAAFGCRGAAGGSRAWGLEQKYKIIH